MSMKLGIDIGSTTVKLVVVKDGKIVHQRYERHFSKVRDKACELLRGAEDVLRSETLKAAITGSAGLGAAKASGIDFVQEVFATRRAVGVHVPKADVVIELGGEDAKIIFLTGSAEPGSGQDLHHRVPLRRIREKRYPAADERRRAP